MSELLPVLDTLLADVEAGRSAALCVVVKTKGSTPQAPGATMLVRSDMSTLGTLGGGCVEAEVRKQAFQLLGQHRSGLLDYILNHDYGWDDGLICGGRMFVGVAPFAPGMNLAALREAAEHARKREPACFPIVIEHEGARREYRVRLEVPPTLLIAGAGHVGRALAEIAANLDFHVVVIDDRADLASRERFGPQAEIVVDDIARALRKYELDSGTCVVIVTRGHQHDHEALDAVIRRNAGYIGLIGSRRKARMILEDLRSAGVSDEQIQRVHTPIGLEIGAVTVPEIAVSITAQLVQFRRMQGTQLVEGPFELAASRE